MDSKGGRRGGPDTHRRNSISEVTHLIEQRSRISHGRRMQKSRPSSLHTICILAQASTVGLPLPRNIERKKIDKGKRTGATPKTTESTPFTRHGYRSGRLAEDFWTALQVPHTPSSPRKTLRVIPFLIKEVGREQPEFLVNQNAQTPQPIAEVQVAEVLAGLPWTESMVRQHIVNEVPKSSTKSWCSPHGLPIRCKSSNKALGRRIGQRSHTHTLCEHADPRIQS